GQRGASKRVIAPIAFVPVSVEIKAGGTPGVTIACKGEGVDRVTPNLALLAWLEQQTGKNLSAELFADEDGADPWREIDELVRRVCDALEIPVPEWRAAADQEGEEEEEKESPATCRGTDGEDRTVAKSNVDEARKDSFSRDPEGELKASPQGSAGGEEGADQGEGEAPFEPRWKGDAASDQRGQDARATGVVDENDASDPSSAAGRAPQAERLQEEPTTPDKPALKLGAAPRTEALGDAPAILPSAVLGLFPVANQGLLRDLQAMNAGEALAGPVLPFVNSAATLDGPAQSQDRAAEAAPPAAVGRVTRNFSDERLVAQADPCQARAVRMARTSRGLVIHGPPGTGKSQTITNIIGDHLSRGLRVLLVSDKRTALDVVANRLAHMGLGNLTALIHDPQRDQRDLYRTIREQLEVLAEAKTDEKAQAKLAKVDAELQALHGELTGYHDALMRDPDGDGPAESFHALVGHWLALPDSDLLPKLEPLADSLQLADLDAHAHLIDETLSRAASVGWSANPWREAVGVDLATFASTPIEKWRQAIAPSGELAIQCDATADPAIPAFVDGVDLPAQVAARQQLATQLEQLRAATQPATREFVLGKDDAALAKLRERIAAVEPQVQAIKAGPLDAELRMVLGDKQPTMGEVAQQLGQLETYLEAAGKWYAFLLFGAKAAGRMVLSRYGLGLSKANGERVKAFLTGLRTRLVVQQTYNEVFGLSSPFVNTDDALTGGLANAAALAGFVQWVKSTPVVAPMWADVKRAMSDDGAAQTLLTGLALSPKRAEAIQNLTQSLASSRLISPEWIGAFEGKLRRATAPGVPVVRALIDKLSDVDPVLRIRAALAKLPSPVTKALDTLIKDPVDPAQSTQALRKVALAAEITRRLRADERLQNVDGPRVSSAFERYRKLEDTKRELVRDVIVHQWVTKQKERLLTGTGNRLNNTGADLKRRLTMRGERAMRLRQVLAAGQRIEGGDPLFDVCPVWMASPETVAQLFPRAEVFSVVIFDEASQCRLEETLPVLTRGQRVVIAGDPKQLPPTRFFESAFTASEEDEPQTDQELFEQQQGDVEDLLAAALNLSIDQAYLDVHYRSKSSELIEFSNEHFYASRLQAIPGHPSNRPEHVPLTLHQISGTYEDRENAAEADKIVELVQNLLKGRTPPSIGIACFNLQQRDLIVEKLDEAAAEEEKFARKLAEARARSGEGSFEGLFVKNLENVQGDERDVMIISTTYGPDATGRFYRRFGPLGRAGGGRRLNVLVTRARHAVHLVTSIPREVYASLPPIPDGQQPTGGWLLFAYLQYAERVSREYARTVGEPASAGGSSAQRENPPPSENDDRSAGPQPEIRAQSEISEGSLVTPLPTKTPSPLAQSLADHLAATHRIPSDLYWGNDGFLVDLALRDPADAARVTVGVLADGARYPAADDPVEWDVFRTGIHEAQGWTLHRVWSPHLFRDPRGTTEAVVRSATTS
ncbi:MAG TPA: AAA domain-containing protein, partial [Tepidisphaeraceae bacterium]|nr:AAA domain-containing protein [Tepidisphaeraceae bacterium]